MEPPRPPAAHGTTHAGAGSDPEGDLPGLPARHVADRVLRGLRWPGMLFGQSRRSAPALPQGGVVN